MSLAGLTGAIADADARFAPHLRDGVDDLQREARAILDSAAVSVVTSVRAVAQELVDEIAVGGMDLDAVEAGPLRAPRAACE